MVGLTTGSGKSWVEAFLISLHPTEECLVIEPDVLLKNQMIDLLSALIDFNYKVVTRAEFKFNPTSFVQPIVIIDEYVDFLCNSPY